MRKYASKIRSEQRIKAKRFSQDNSKDIAASSSSELHKFHLDYQFFTMHFTNAFSLIAAYALFATANGATVHDDFTVALTRLHGAGAEVHEALHVRDVNSATAEPTVIANDIATIIHDGTTIGKDIHQLITDLKSNPKAKAQPDAAKIIDDAAKVAQDITTLVDDISTLAKALTAGDSGKPKPAPAPIPHFPFQ